MADPLNLDLLKQIASKATPGLYVERGNVTTKSMTLTVRFKPTRRCNPDDFEYAMMLFACGQQLIEELAEARARLSPGSGGAGK